MKSIAIIEDSKYCMENILDKLLETKNNHKNHNFEINTYTSGEEVLDAYINEKKKFDLIFLDIQMPGISGVKTAKQLRKFGYENAIAFTTSYEEYDYAKEGCDLGIIQYIVKPVKYEDVEKCINKIMQKKYFTYSYKHNHYKLAYDDITYFESALHYMKIHLLNETEPVVFLKSMAELCDELPDFFVRCHRSFIVNLSHMKTMQNNKIFLQNNIVVKVSAVYLNDVLEALRYL